MSVDAAVRRALNPKRLPLPSGGPRVVRIEVEDFVDHTGEDSLRVWVIIPDDYDEKEITGRWVVDLKGAIHDSLIARRIDLFPYTSIVTESDRREMLAGA